MRKIISGFLLLIAFIFTLTTYTSAHSGRTDSNGGHLDHSTGEYHYHHGYPEHDHYDIDSDGFIDCPYLFHYSSDLDSEKDATTKPTEEISLDMSALEAALESMEDFEASMEEYKASMEKHESLLQYVPTTTSPALYSNKASVSGSNDQSASYASSSSPNSFFICIGIIGVLLLYKHNKTTWKKENVGSGNNPQDHSSSEQSLEKPIK